MGWQLVTTPYISNLSEVIRRVLAPLDIQVVFRPLMTLRQLLVYPKDQVPMDERKGVVYSIPCTVRPKVYIGQTGRSLKHWLKEHRCVLRNGDVAASALAEHALVAGHGIDLSKTEVFNSKVISFLNVPVPTSSTFSLYCWNHAPRAFFPAIIQSCTMSSRSKCSSKTQPR